MSLARRQTVLFLICAAVLLGAGFACGYIYSFNGFYSPDAQLDHELVEMDFNTRQLYYANQGRRADCQRELVKQLRGQMLFVNKMLASAPETKNRVNAQASVQQAQSAIDGQPINVGAR